MGELATFSLKVTLVKLSKEELTNVNEDIRHSFNVDEIFDFQGAVSNVTLDVFNANDLIHNIEIDSEISFHSTSHFF